MFQRIREELSFIHGNVLVLMTSLLLTVFVSAIPNTYSSLYVLKLGGTPFIVGLIGSASLIIIASGQFLGGYVTDTRGRKQLLLLMTLGIAASYIVFATSLSWHFMLLGTLIQSIFMIFRPAQDAIIADSIPPRKRGLGYAVFTMAGAVSIFSPLVAGFLYSTQGLVFGMRIAFWIAAISFFAAAVMRLRLEETLKPNVNKARLKDALKIFKNSIVENLMVWKVLPRNAFFLFAVGLLPMFFVNMTIPYYVIYTTTVLKVNELHYAMLMTWELIVYYAALLPTGKIVDKIGRKYPLILSSVLYIFGIWLFINGDISRLYIASFLFAIGNSLTFVALPSLQADVVPREHRGKFFGFSNFAVSILASISILLGGFIYENVSVQLPFILQLFSMVPTAILTLLLIHEPEKREK